MALDYDLKRLALNYVQRQCSYMDISPSAIEQDRAAIKIYRVLKKLQNAQKKAKP